MINLVKPNYFIPIHGELHHLAAHAHTAKGCGISNTFVVENGQSVCFENNDDEIRGFLGETISAGRIMVDGKGVGDVTDIVLRDRQQLAAGGLVICVLSVADGELAQGPDIFMRGISADAPLLEEAKEWVKKPLAELTPEARRDRAVIEESVRVSLRRFFRRQLERKPVIVPVVIVL
jgi:ribonuclease J